MLRRDANGIVTYHFQSLEIEGLVHAVFTRLGGVSQGAFAALNVGHTVGDDEAAVAENHARIYALLGLDAGQIVSPRQVHGNRVGVVTASDAGRIVQSTDGLVTVSPGVALLLRFADCQPILLYDPVHHAVGLIHAGWRGVAQGVARRAVERMVDRFGSRPEALIAGLGPAIGPCCYTVGNKVATAMAYVLPEWNQVMTLEGEDLWRFDLSAANAQQLAAEGVQQIEQAHLCTACRQDEFYSHRADNGRTGRFAVVTYLEPRRVGGEAQAGTVPREERPVDGPDIVSLHPPGFPAFDEFTGGDL